MPFFLLFIVIVIETSKEMEWEMGKYSAGKGSLSKREFSIHLEISLQNVGCPQIAPQASIAEIVLRLTRKRYEYYLLFKC